MSRYIDWDLAVLGSSGLTLMEKNFLISAGVVGCSLIFFTYLCLGLLVVATSVSLFVETGKELTGPICLDSFGLMPVVVVIPRPLDLAILAGTEQLIRSIDLSTLLTSSFFTFIDLRRVAGVVCRTRVVLAKASYFLIFL